MLQNLLNFLRSPFSPNQLLHRYSFHLQGTYDKLKSELSRCEGEKRRHIKVFVDRIRKEILTMWDLLLKSDEEREQFGAFTSECFNEDLLQLHELELEALKDAYEENKFVPLVKYNMESLC